MSNHSGGRSYSTLPPTPETIRHYSSLGDLEELEIERTSDTFLRITKLVYRDGSTNPNRETERIDLTREAVLPLYTITDNTNLTKLWHIRVVYGGGGPAPQVVNYELRTEQDAFAFQRLITGYSPYRRFKNVEASALEQRTFWQAREVYSFGEVQLWSFQQPEPPDAEPPPVPLSPAQTGLSVGGSSASGYGSVISLAQTVRVQTDLMGREVAVTMAKPPPLLVLFAKAAAPNYGKKAARMAYQMWRVEGEFQVPLSVVSISAGTFCHQFVLLTSSK